MSICITILERALKYYDDYKDGELFTVQVAAGLECLKMPELAKKVEDDPVLAYEVAKNIVKDYYSLEKEPIVVTLDIRKLVDQLQQVIAQQDRSND